jgi:hypothetical protein
MQLLAIERIISSQCCYQLVALLYGFPSLLYLCSSCRPPPLSLILLPVVYSAGTVKDSVPFRKGRYLSVFGANSHVGIEDCRTDLAVHQSAAPSGGNAVPHEKG